MSAASSCGEDGEWARRERRDGVVAVAAVALEVAPHPDDLRPAVHPTLVLEIAEEAALRQQVARRVAAAAAAAAAATPAAAAAAALGSRRTRHAALAAERHARLKRLALQFGRRPMRHRFQRHEAVHEPRVAERVQRAQLGLERVQLHVRVVLRLRDERGARPRPPRVLEPRHRLLGARARVVEPWAVERVEQHDVVVAIALGEQHAPRAVSAPAPRPAASTAVPACAAARAASAYRGRARSGMRSGPQRRARNAASSRAPGRAGRRQTAPRPCRRR